MSEHLRYNDTVSANILGRETPRPAEDLLRPGTVIELADITELHAFEDLIAKDVDPKLNQDHWDGRPKLRDLIRPPKFNGTIANITLEVMDEPYERLLDARERGWKLPGPRYDQIADESRMEKFKGFSFTADAKSSGRGVVGQIKAELFYYSLDKKPSQHHKGIHRVVTKPKIETERFVQLDETSRRIAFVTLREAMKHPMRG